MKMPTEQESWRGPKRATKYWTRTSLSTARLNMRKYFCLNLLWCTFNKNVALRYLQKICDPDVYYGKKCFKMTDEITEVSEGQCIMGMYIAICIRENFKFSFFLYDVEEVDFKKFGKTWIGTKPNSLFGKQTSSAIVGYMKDSVQNFVNLFPVINMSLQGSSKCSMHIKEDFEISHGSIEAVLHGCAVIGGNTVHLLY